MYFYDAFQTKYLKIYLTDLRQIFGVGRTTAVDNQSEINSSISQGALPIFVGFIQRTDGCRWTQAASGAAGRANVGLCPASSLFTFFLLVQSCFFGF